MEWSHFLQQPSACRSGSLAGQRHAGGCKEARYVWRKEDQPESAETVPGAGVLEDETLLDCWDRTVETYPEREYVVDDRGTVIPTGNWMRQQAGWHRI